MAIIKVWKVQFLISKQNNFLRNCQRETSLVKRRKLFVCCCKYLNNFEVTSNEQIRAAAAAAVVLSMVIDLVSASIDCWLLIVVWRAPGNVFVYACRWCQPHSLLPSALKHNYHTHTQAILYPPSCVCVHIGENTVVAIFKVPIECWAPKQVVQL